MEYLEITGKRAGPRIRDAADIPGEFGIEYGTVPSSFAEKDAREISEEDLKGTDLTWEKFKPVSDFVNLASGSDIIEGLPWYYEILFEYTGDHPIEVGFNRVEQTQHIAGGARLSSTAEYEPLEIVPGESHTYQFDLPSPSVDGIMQIEIQPSTDDVDRLRFRDDDGSENAKHSQVLRVNENESLRQLYQLSSEGHKDDS
ncbi:hypothetical protein [Haloferax volcanii]|uniref:Uncharacterized protein n=2 Tax=Haloferax volcanii TaxID=2246 RepID=A0A1C9J6T3_HALVD|nr:hypothetical protein [Haloferax volcanii]AOP12809.1 uncharacterized protein HVO_0379B [Haloferax volcanii DS2]MBS8119033.1 hypothetical protein [Haloferax volcanii]MBS8124047.1 hypothetical protein [Haloferax volcanii]MBS8127916.1 hypothetical protein [Haloferax volcanii]MBS8131781.1 hypothetical protein [Haloferax volcanii]